MTTEIEQTRREMYDALKKITSVQLNGQQFFGPEFENALESHLEALRVEHKKSTERELFLEALSSGFAEQRDLACQQRNELRNKLQAFEFANKSAGELLRDALATVKRQREFIMARYASPETRKGKGSTSAQSEQERVACGKCGGSGRILIGLSGFPVIPLTEQCACRVAK